MDIENYVHLPGFIILYMYFFKNESRFLGVDTHGQPGMLEELLRIASIYILQDGSGHDEIPVHHESPPQPAVNIAAEGEDQGKDAIFEGAEDIHPGLQKQPLVEPRAEQVVYNAFFDVYNSIRLEACKIKCEVICYE